MGTREPRCGALIASALAALLASASLATAFDLGNGGLPAEYAQKVFGDEITDVSFVPIPEIILDPNEGNTFGVMGAWLLLNDADEIKYMVAPDVRYNATKGVFPSFRLFGYPTDTRRYTVQVGKSTTRDEDYEFEYADRGLWDERAFLLGKFLYERDSTERFYGFGNDSDENNESNYTGEDLYAEATPGVWIVPKLSVSYRMKIERFNVQRGQVSSVPFINAPRFRRNGETDVRRKGLHSSVYFSHKLQFTYDTRDSIDLPSRGAMSLIYVDAADQSLGSSSSFLKFGFESRGFIPFREVKNPILALRVLADYVTGPSDTPFWERSSLGGRRTLRGFGGDRFIGFNRALGSAELRTNVYKRKLFGVNAELEVAPFLEAGQVFKGVTTSPVNDLHWVYGLGFRGLVRPQILAFVDVGRGSEGISVFTGIDYPF
jgi:Omp85 superfamily domain